ARGYPVRACRLWTWHARASGDMDKAARNIIRCARSTTKSRIDESAIAEGLECWGCLAAIGPRSAEARQGIAWCRASLARAAEQKQDWPAARRHWSALLELFPNDAGALEGLQLTREAEANASPHNGE